MYKYDTWPSLCVTVKLQSTTSLSSKMADIYQKQQRQFADYDNNTKKGMALYHKPPKPMAKKIPELSTRQGTLDSQACPPLQAVSLNRPSPENSY